jgi:APA family basic amino acid/polyamine antiporter
MVGAVFGPDFALCSGRSWAGSLRQYSKEVERPERTVPLAGAVALAAVSLVYLATAAALQTLASGAAGAPTMALVLLPLFGPAADWVAGILGGGLCLATLLMFTGAVTRMTAQRGGKEGCRGGRPGSPGLAGPA